MWRGHVVLRSSIPRDAGLVRLRIRTRHNRDHTLHYGIAPSGEQDRENVRASSAVVVSCLFCWDVGWLRLRRGHYRTLDGRDVLGGGVLGEHRAAHISGKVFPLRISLLVFSGILPQPDSGMRLLRHNTFS